MRTGLASAVEALRRRIKDIDERTEPRLMKIDQLRRELALNEEMANRDTDERFEIVSAIAELEALE